MLSTALPLAIAVFPQVSEIKARSLEPEFHDLRDDNGEIIDTLYYNKGL